MDDLKNVGESNYNPGEGTDQRVQSLVFIGNDDWQCLYIRGNAPMYAVLSKAEKYVPYVELICTRESISL